MTHYSIQPRAIKCIKGYGFLPLARHLSDKYLRKIWDTATKTGLVVVQLKQQEN